MAFPILVAIRPTKYWEFYTSGSRKRVEREIEGKKSLFHHNLSSAQLAVSSLKYLIFSFDLPRASGSEGVLKTP